MTVDLGQLIIILFGSADLHGRLLVRWSGELPLRIDSPVAPFFLQIGALVQCQWNRELEKPPTLGYGRS